MMEFATLQDAFFIVSIVYMAFMMAIAITFLVIFIVIINKVKTMQQQIKSKFDFVSMFTKRGKSFLDGFKQGLDK